MSRTTRTFALLVPFALIVALVGGIQPAMGQIAPTCPRPDAQIKGGPASLLWVGDNIYSPTSAVGQTFQRQVRPTYRDQFNIKIENDGDVNCVESQGLWVRGQGTTSRYIITYYSIDPISGLPVANITAAVVAGTYQTDPLDPGESAFIRVYIYVRPGVPSGSSITDLIYVGSDLVVAPRPRVFADTTVRDVVGARVVVNRRAGDFNSSLPTL